MADEGISRLSTDNVQVQTWYYVWKIMKRVFKAFLLLIVAIIALYVFVFVPTTLRYVNTDSFGTVITRDPTIRDGRIPDGKIELVTLAEDMKYTETLGGKFKAAFTPHTYVSKMKVVTGKTGRVLVNDDGTVEVNGKTVSGMKKPVNYEMIKNQKYYLENQYIMACLDGACDTGEYYIVNSGSVLGELKTNDADTPLNELLARKNSNGNTDSSNGNETEDSDSNNGDTGASTGSDSTGSSSKLNEDGSKWPTRPGELNTKPMDKKGQYFSHN